MEKERGAVGARTFAEIARNFRPRGSVQDTLDRTVSIALEIIDGGEAAGVSLIVQRNNRTCVETPASKGYLAVPSSHLQQRFGKDLCLNAMQSEEIFEIENMTEEKYRSSYERSAAELGVGSAIAFRLFTCEASIGSLTIYASRPHAFGPQSRDVGTVFAAHASVALSSVRTHAELKKAILGRGIIGQAIGILMARRLITSGQALGVLRQASQDRNARLRALAEYVCDAGELPDPP